MIHVLVADDHAIVRRGLVDILSGAPDVEVAGEAASGPEALESARVGVDGRPFDIVVLDLSMPGPSGVDVLKQLRAEQPVVPVLILSAHPEDQYAVRVLRAGAAGYLSKDSAPDDLVTAVRKVAAGGRYVSPGAAEALLLHLDRDPEEPVHQRLSDREFQVLRRLAQGEAVGEIADALSLSAKTVSTYRSRLLEKMGLRSNADLARYAIEHGLI